MDMPQGARLGISSFGQVVGLTPCSQAPLPPTICEEVNSLSSGLSELINRLHELEIRLGIAKPGPCEKLADAPSGLRGVLSVVHRQLNEANDISINLYQQL